MRLTTSGETCLSDSSQQNLMRPNESPSVGGRLADGYEQFESPISRSTEGLFMFTLQRVGVVVKRASTAG